MNVYQSWQAERWNSAKLGRKVDWVKRGKWVTAKGGLSRRGEKIAETEWSNLSGAARKIITVEIEKDYPQGVRVSR